MAFSRLRRSGVFIVATFVLVSACGPRYSDQDIAAASQRLSHLYDLRNYEIGMQEGRQWQDAGPRAFEPRAWFVLNTARYSQSEDLSDSTVAWGEAMTKQAPDNPWAWFALAAALNNHRSRGEEALAASDSMMRLGSGISFLRLRDDVLRDQVSDSAGLAFLDSLAPAVQKNPVLLVRRGVDEFYRGMASHDDSLI
ncbi:MAG: hypothetical protein P8174_07085, partial [Gemmatimonadota bacterium]